MLQEVAKMDKKSFLFQIGKQWESRCKKRY
ncbi:hypothetical protein AAZX31_02G036200 [Glycine max]